MLGSVISAGHPAAATTVSRETNLVHRGTTHPPAPVPIRLSCPDPTHATSLAPHTHSISTPIVSCWSSWRYCIPYARRLCNIVWCKDSWVITPKLPTSEIHNPRRRRVAGSAHDATTATPLPGDAPLLLHQMTLSLLDATITMLQIGTTHLV